VSAEITAKKYAPTSSDSKTSSSCLNNASVFESFKTAFEENDIPKVQAILKHLVGNPSSVPISDMVTIRHLLNKSYNLTKTSPAIVGELLSHFAAKDFSDCYDRLHAYREDIVILEAQQISQARTNLECLLTSPTINSAIAKKKDSFAGWMGSNSYTKLYSTALETATFPTDRTAATVSVTTSVQPINPSNAAGVAQAKSF
jgi:hypothetical protein